MAHDDASALVRCDFAILAAQDRELASLLQLTDHTAEMRPSGEMLYHLRIPPPDGIGGSELFGVAARTGGFGRVEAAVAASQILHAVTPQLFFLAGVAGGFATNGMELGDLIVASRIVDYEEQRWGEDGREFRLKSFAADELLLAASRTTADTDWSAKLVRPKIGRPRLHFGSILSGDKVIASERLASSLLLQHPSALGVEMEGSGVAAAVSRANHFVRFLMIRGVVDLANEKKREDSRIWLDATCDAVASFTIATLLQMRYGE